jgi:hypothetical protein
MFRWWAVVEAESSPFPRCYFSHHSMFRVTEEGAGDELLEVVRGGVERDCDYFPGNYRIYTSASDALH